MLMECRTNRYNNPYMVRLPAAAAAAGAVGLGRRKRFGVPKLLDIDVKPQRGKEQARKR